MVMKNSDINRQRGQIKKALAAHIRPAVAESILSYMERYVSVYLDDHTKEKTRIASPATEETDFVYEVPAPGDYFERFYHLQVDHPTSVQLLRHMNVDLKDVAATMNADLAEMFEDEYPSVQEVTARPEVAEYLVARTAYAWMSGFSPSTGNQRAFEDAVSKKTTTSVDWDDSYPDNEFPVEYTIDFGFDPLPDTISVAVSNNKAAAVMTFAVRVDVAWGNT